MFVGFGFTSFPASDVTMSACNKGPKWHTYSAATHAGIWHDTPPCYIIQTQDRPVAVTQPRIITTTGADVLGIVLGGGYCY